MKKSHLLLLLLFCSTFTSFTETIVVEDCLDQEKATVALIPFFGNDVKDENDAKYTAFIDAHYELVDSAKIMQNVSSHKVFNSWVNTIPEMIKNDVKSGYQTFVNLTESEILEIQSDCLSADLLVYSSNVKVTTVKKLNGNVSKTAAGSMIVVDLQTGVLQSFCEKKIKIKNKKDVPNMKKLISTLVTEQILCIE